jgi:hypothetical protein
VDGSTLRYFVQTAASHKARSQPFHSHNPKNRRIDRKNIIVIKGASSGFGALAARAQAIRRSTGRAGAIPPGGYGFRSNAVKLWAGLWIGVWKDFPAKPLKEMVGTRRLELLTSTVSR